MPKLRVRNERAGAAPGWRPSLATQERRLTGGRQPLAKPRRRRATISALALAAACSRQRALFRFCVGGKMRRLRLRNGAHEPIDRSALADESPTELQNMSLDAFCATLRGIYSNFHP